jgi:hypothetical protein
MAADLFVVPTVTFRLLFVLVILAHDRRRIVHVASRYLRAQLSVGPYLDCQIVFPVPCPVPV